MGENNSGFRGFLAYPWIYKWTRDLFGLNRWLCQYVKHYIKPQVGDRVLDIGCGTGEVIRYLSATTYVGVDRHRPYIDFATRHFGSHGRFICADVADHIEVFRDSFDIVIANGLLHHLEDSLANRLFQIGAQVLSEKGRMITVDPCRYPGQARITRFIVNRDRGSNVRQLEEYPGLARDVFPDVRSSLWHGFAPIPFSVCVVECRKTPARITG